jgi:hypothetical protein
MSSVRRLIGGSIGFINQYDPGLAANIQQVLDNPRLDSDKKLLEAVARQINLRPNSAKASVELKDGLLRLLNDANTLIQQQPIISEQEEIVRQENAAHNREQLLFGLPNELLQKINEELPLSDQARLAAASRRLFNPNVIKAASKQVHKLLTHALWGEKAEVLAMLEKDPGLLLQTGTVEGIYGGKHKDRTVYQLIIGAEDYDMEKDVRKLFDRLPNGEAERAKQFKGQYPDDYDPDQYEKYNFKALVDIIATDPCRDYDATEPSAHATQTKLEAFRDHFTPKPTDEFTTGKHFDMRIFLDAIVAYDEHFNDFKNDVQRSMYCRFVMGYLQRLFPANAAQAFRQGLANVVDENRQRERSNENGDASLFYPRDRGKRVGLGFSHFVFSYYVGGEWTGCWTRRESRPLKNYVEQTLQSWKNLREDCKIHQRHRPG